MALTLVEKEMRSRIDDVYEVVNSLFEKSRDRVYINVDPNDDDVDGSLMLAAIIKTTNSNTLQLARDVTNEFKRPVYLKKFIESKEREKRLQNFEIALTNLKQRIDLNYYVPDDGWNNAIHHINKFSRLLWLKTDEDILADDGREAKEREDRTDAGVEKMVAAENVTVEILK